MKRKKLMYWLMTIENKINKIEELNNILINYTSIQK